MSEFGYQVLGFGGGGGNTSNYDTAIFGTPASLDITSATSLDAYLLSSSEALLFSGSRPGSGEAVKDFNVYISTRTDTVWGAADATKKAIFTANGSATFSQVPDTNYRVCVLSSTKAFVLYESWERLLGVDTLKVMGAVITVAAGVITVGTPVTLVTFVTGTPSSPDTLNAVALTETTLFISYDARDGAGVRMVVATVSGSTFSIGTSVDLSTETTLQEIRASSRISDNSALFVGSNGAAQVAFVLVHSGGTITTPITTNALSVSVISGSGRYYSLTKAKNGKYIYDYTGDDTKRSAVIINTVGNAFSSVSSELDFASPSATVTKLDAENVSETQTLCAYVIDGGSATLYAYVLNNRADTPTLAAANFLSITSLLGSAVSIVKIAKNKYSVFYDLSGSLKYVTVTLS